MRSKAAALALTMRWPRLRSDVAGALLWSVSLYFASPLQLLLLFLGRIDVERPSDFTLLCVALVVVSGHAK